MSMVMVMLRCVMISSGMAAVLVRIAAAESSAATINYV